VNSYHHRDCVQPKPDSERYHEPRWESGESIPALGSAIMTGSRLFPLIESGCVPPQAAAFSLNITTIPRGYLGYLSLLPSLQAQAFISTLNSWNGQVVANASLAPAGSQGAPVVAVSNPAKRRHRYEWILRAVSLRMST
jgi:hypothetical protein